MLKANQALVNDFIDQAFGLPIAHENAKYTPAPGTAFVRLRVFQNAENAGDIGVDTRQSSGFLRCTLHYPLGEGAITARATAQTIFDAYPIGRRITYSAETVTVQSVQLFDASPQGGWFQVVGRIFYELS